MARKESVSEGGTSRIELTRLAFRNESEQLLLDDSPRVGSRLLGVEAAEAHELLQVDVRWAALEALPRDFEDALFLLREDRLLLGGVSCRGWGGFGGRHVDLVVGGGWIQS